MSTKVRVLLVDDDEEDYLIIRSLFGKIPGTPFSLDWTADASEARTHIKNAAHDVYLVDYRLGAEDGLELLSHYDLLQRREPFIILTGAGDERVEQRAMDIGVADYLIKGSLDSELLARVLRYSLQRKHSEMQRVEQLMEINRSKDEFIALASHQLRTPATAVKQYVGMVLEGYAGEITPEMRRFLTSAYESNERQIQVVNDILRVAKLDLKKIVLKQTDVDLGQLMESISHDMASHLEGRQQNLKLKLPKKPVIASADTEYIRMALGNILDNASKYTTPGKSIGVSVAMAEDGCAQVNICDEGVGISAEDIDKLFKKFSRIDNPLSVKVGGTGLGLYWSNEVVGMHNGHIEVVSEVGKGTTFKVYLPATSGDDTFVHRHSSPKKASRFPQA